MVSLHKTHLLFVEPTNAPTQEPIEDELTAKVDFIFSKLQKGELFRGQHDTEFGISSDNVNYIHPKYDIVSNSLAPYYIRHHRKDIPEELIENINEIYDILLTDNGDEYWEKIAEKDIYYFKTWQLKARRRYGSSQTTAVKMSGAKEDITYMLKGRFYKELSKEKFEKEALLGKEICRGRFPFLKLCEIYVLSESEQLNQTNN